MSTCTKPPPYVSPVQIVSAAIVAGADEESVEFLTLPAGERFEANAG